MNFKFLTTVLTGLLLLASCFINSANAGIITHGYLTTDDTTNFITDTETGRRYTRFDAFSLTASQTIAAIGLGGAFEGWSIATSAIADDFYAAVLGIEASVCEGVVTHGSNCGEISGWVEGDFGVSFQTGYDIFAFINTDTSVPVGNGQIDSRGAIKDYASNMSIERLDNDPTRNYLLYIDAKVPEPSTLAIFALGMIGLASRRLKKQS
jgi:hypothetical protein